MELSIFIIILSVNNLVFCLQGTTTSTSTTLSDFLTPEKAGLQCKLPLNQKDIVQTLKRALEIAQKSGKRKRPQRGQEYETSARSLLRFLAQDESYAAESDSSQESPVKGPKLYQPEDVDFCMPQTSFGSGRRTSLDTMKRIIALADQGKNEPSIRSQYKWYKRQYLSDFRRCVAESGSHSMKRDQINEAAKNYAQDLERRMLPLKGWMIKGFARRTAVRIGAPWFKASKGWLDGFKVKHRLSSRKVTKVVTRPRVVNSEQIEANRLNFLKSYERNSKYFRRRDIWNSDQSGVKYENTNDRTLATKGKRTIYLRVDSANKVSHTYTAQPIMSRDGRLIGPLTLVLQESSLGSEPGQFSVGIQKKVDALVEKYGNLKIFATSSGKMTAQLMSIWIRDVLTPLIRQASTYPIDENVPIYEPPEDVEKCVERLEEVTQRDCRGNNWVGRVFGTVDEECLEDKKLEAIFACKHPDVMFLADSWSGQSSANMLIEAHIAGALPLVIPPHTTDEVQPMDVGFFRQFKKLLKRLTEEALIANRIGEVTSRDGVINIMSLIHNQLQSPIYRDLWTNSWRHTDVNFDLDELVNEVPLNVNNVQFNFDPAAPCSVPNCTEDTVIRCSHCGQNLCLTHFLERTHFHEIDDNENVNPDMNIDLVNDPYDIEDEDDDVDLTYAEFLSMPEMTSTTPGPDPLMEQFSNFECGCVE